MNRSLLLTASLGLFASVSADDVLTWRVAKGTTLVRTFESGARVELQSLSVKVDGEDQETGPAPEMTISHDFAYEFSDSIEAVESKRPAKLVRNFTKLTSARSRTVKVPDQDAREEKFDTESDLEGKRVSFVRDDSSWTAKWATDEKGDDALLKGLEAEVDFCAFLPAKSVAADDSWDLEASLFKNFLRPAGNLSRKAKGEDVAKNNQYEAKLDESLAGKGTATYRGTREEDGAKVAVIALSAELSMHAGDEMDAGKSGIVETNLELSYKLEGEILWDIAGGFARRATLAGSVERVQSENRTVQVPDGEHKGEHKIEQQLSFTGKVTYKAGIEPKS